MRLTRDMLINIARETALKRSLSDKGLVAAYLTGSLLTEDPLLGGTTDIDLVLIHEEKPGILREIIGVTPEVHLDIVHTNRGEYANPKELRTHPSLGPELYNPLWLFETHHFLEFVQAAVRTRFQDPVNVLERARRSCREARQSWLTIQADISSASERLEGFLHTIDLAANAIALLNGPPLSERRFQIQFPARAVLAERPDLVVSFTHLLGLNGVDLNAIKAFMSSWEKTFIDASTRTQVHPCIAYSRLGYYKQAIFALLEGEMPQAAIWPLIYSWTRASQSQPVARHSHWQECCEMLGLNEAGLDERMGELDRFIDQVEDILDNQERRSEIKT